MLLAFEGNITTNKLVIFLLLFVDDSLCHCLFDSIHYSFCQIVRDCVCSLYLYHWR